MVLDKSLLRHHTLTNSSMGTPWKGLETLFVECPISVFDSQFGSEERVVIWVGLCFLALVKPAIYAGFAIS
jgi:hypothetical protein